MAHPKSQVQTYTTDWGKVKAWAAQQKIPTTAVNNVQLLDQSRLQSGYYPMSDAERTRAILAAAGMNYSTALPTDNPSPSDVVGNTIRNVQGIATGLMPTRLVSNIWDTLKTSVKDIEHPQQTGGLGKALENTALSWLPGAYDLGQVIQAHGLVKGLEDLASQPITSILDVMPFLSAGDAAIGALAATGSAEDAATAALTRVAPRVATKMKVRDISTQSTSLGDTLAARTGMTPRGVAKLGAARMAGKAVGSITLGHKEEAYMPAVAGKEAVRVPTLSERASNRAMQTGTGRVLSKAAHTLGTVTTQGTYKFRDLTKTLHKKVADLSPDVVDDNNVVTKEGEQGEFTRIMDSLKVGDLSPDQVINSTEISVPVKEAVKAYTDWEDWHKQWMVDSGKAISMPIREADGTISHSIYGVNEAGALAPFRRAAERSQTRADELSAGSDEIMSRIQALDDAYTPLRNDLNTAQQQLIDSMGVTKSYVRKSFTDLIGSVIGKDGLMDQMDSAFRAKDWGLYSKLAKRALRRMDSPRFEGETPHTRPHTIDFGNGPTPLKRVTQNQAYKDIPPDSIRLFRGEHEATARRQEGGYGMAPGQDNQFFAASYHIADGYGRGPTGEPGRVFAFDIPAPMLRDHILNEPGNSSALADRQIQAMKDAQGSGRDPDIGRDFNFAGTTRTQAGLGSPAIVHLKQALNHAYAHGSARSLLEKQYLRAYTSKVDDANKEAQRTQDSLLRESTRRAPEYHDLIMRKYFDNLLASDKAEAILEAGANRLVKEHKWARDAADKLRRENPQRLFEIVAMESDHLFHDPFLPQMTPRDHQVFMQDALKEVTSLRARGHPPTWVPSTTAEQAEVLARQGDRVYVSPTRFPSVKSAHAKGMDMSRSVNDVMIGVDRATKEAMSWDASIEFTNSIIKPMLKARSTLRKSILNEGGAAERFAGTTGARGVVDALIGEQFGLSRFNVKPLLDADGHVLEESDLAKATGLNAEDLGLDPNETYYIPTAFKKQLDGLVGNQFPAHGAWDASTKVFKYSILGLSPRYTAHIVFGGGLLLALRIDPQSFALIGQAAKMVSQYHKGTLNDSRLADIFQGATQRGTPEQTFHTAAGDKMFKLNVQEWLARHHINPKAATAVDVAKAGADINFRFTNYISDMQKSIAYLDGMKRAKAQRYFDDPLTGERIEASDDRLHFEAMQAAERVMGNLQAMTPLERSIARKIMPFYGWTKHILKYILTFPTDHPWRVMFLSTLATQNTDNFSSGLDERMQLLLFLGQPDPSGNVSAVDIRAMDPFRDVANYATLGGWLSAMNPIITAPITAIDPSIIYGGNTLYPNVTYSQLYGTNVAQPQGGLLTAAEQEIPEIGALDQALGLSANARAVKKEGGTNALKDTLSSLGFPWTVQKLNLQQIAAKHELDRYNQAKTDAATAWQTGDFSALDKYPGKVPDPLGTGYNITPKQLQEQYQRALKLYPGLPPSETVPNLPTAPL